MADTQGQLLCTHRSLLVDGKIDMFCCQEDKICHARVLAGAAQQNLS